MPTSKYYFPRFYNTTSDRNKANHFWDLDTDFQSTDYKAVFLRFTAEELYASSKPESLSFKTANLVNDLFEIRNAGLLEKESCDAFQFYYCAHILNFFSRNKRFNEAHTWVINSIGDNVGNIYEDSIEVTYGLKKLANLLLSKDGSVQFLMNQVLFQWLEDVFYSARSSGNMTVLAEALLRIILQYFSNIDLKTVPLSFTMALIQVASWCYQYHFLPELETCNKKLGDIFNMNDDRAIKKAVAFQLAVGMPTGTSLSKADWLEIVRKEYWNDLQQHEKFQILVNSYVDDVEKLKKNLDELINEVLLFQLDEESEAQITTHYHLSHIFDILNPAINVLAEQGYVSEANRLIGAFFSIPEKNLIAPDFLIIIPNITKRIIYCVEGKLGLSLSSSEDAITRITKSGDKFLGKITALKGNREYAAPVPKNLGIPDRLLADEYFHALDAHFQIEEIAKSLNLSQRSGYYVSYDNQFHIQNIIALKSGITLPLIRNFVKPKLQRKIKCAFIWQGHTFSTEKARIGIQEIFAKKGVEVVWKEPETSSKQEFLKEYSSNDYDLFWVLGHGNFEHYNTHNSTLDIGCEDLVTIDDLDRFNYYGENRRLLILDVCDGSTSHFRGPKSLGIGVTVTHSSQSLFGHAWPVENLPSLILALLIASFLSEDLTYAEAHQRTISKFYEGKDEVISHLKMYLENEDVLKRIENAEINFRNFCFWGSLNYIE